VPSKRRNQGTHTYNREPIWVERKSYDTVVDTIFMWTRWLQLLTNISCSYAGRPYLCCKSMIASVRTEWSGFKWHCRLIKVNGFVEVLVRFRCHCTALRSCNNNRSNLTHLLKCIDEFGRKFFPGSKWPVCHRHRCHCHSVDSRTIPSRKISK